MVTHSFRIDATVTTAVADFYATQTKEIKVLHIQAAD